MPARNSTAVGRVRDSSAVRRRRGRPGRRRGAACRARAASRPEGRPAGRSGPSRTAAPGPSFGRPRCGCATEKSLQPLRPSKQEAPACQARWSTPTNWVSRPSRSIRKCAETRSPASSAMNGWSAVAASLRNSWSTHPLPKRPGGRLMLCRTSNSTAAPAGRASQFGLRIRLAPSIQPSGPIRSGCTASTSARAAAFDSGTAGR